MDTREGNSSRRAFFLKGGAALGAGVASAAGAATLLPGAAAYDDLAEREAIRQLHQAFIAGVELQAREGAAATHRAYRSNAAQRHDVLQVDACGQKASACWHVDVKVASMLEGDSTAAQMARLQGHLVDLHWETGTLEARYEKRDGQWQLTAMEYLAS